MKKNPLLLIAALTGATLLLAQPSESSPEQGWIRLVFLSGGGKVPPVNMKGEDDWIPVRIPQSYLSDPVPYNGPNPITFWVEQTEENDQPSYQEVANAQLPEDSDLVLLLFGANTGSPESPKYPVQVVDFTEATFPQGSFYLINATGQRILGMIGKTHVDMQPGERKTVAPSEYTNPGVVESALAYPAVEESLISTAWFLQTDERKMVVITGSRTKPNLISTYAFTLFDSEE